MHFEADNKNGERRIRQYGERLFLKSNNEMHQFFKPYKIAHLIGGVFYRNRLHINLAWCQVGVRRSITNGDERCRTP